MVEYKIIIFTLSGLVMFCGFFVSVLSCLYCNSNNIYKNNKKDEDTISEVTIEMDPEIRTVLGTVPEPRRRPEPETETEVREIDFDNLNENINTFRNAYIMDDILENEEYKIMVSFTPNFRELEGESETDF